MNQFTFERATAAEPAIAAAARSNTAQLGATVRFVAGGTNLVDLMKLNVERPQHVIDINALAVPGIDKIERQPDGSLRIGALVRNSDAARDANILRDYPVLSQALLAGASPQLRNMATTGGNLLQRTRCVYFRDTAHACNKRNPGSGCGAMDGYHRNLAILGTSDACIATNPSDQNVALTALEATIQIRGVNGDRTVPISDFYLLPGSAPERETVLEPGDLITHVTLPAPSPGARSVYLKLRDREAYEFALASAAVVATVRNGSISRVRIALGGVGTRPWRSPEAEAALTGKPVNAANFSAAAEAALASAKPRAGNAFKVELAKRCLTRALTLASTHA
jgi:xanthine dehydrogenase YagS FAD-binding subunit